MVEPDVKEALKKAAGWKRKTASQYLRDLLVDDLERTGALQRRRD